MSRDERRELAAVRETTVSLAVRLTDRFTGGRPVGSPGVSVAGYDAAAVENPSGYRVFLDLPETLPEPVAVTVDGTARYESVREAVDLSERRREWEENGVEPLVDLELTPTPAYDFPAGTTLVRGQLWGAAGAPVSGATIALTGRPSDSDDGSLDRGGGGGHGAAQPDVAGSDGPSNGGADQAVGPVGSFAAETSETGEFVLFFTALGPDDVRKEGGERVVTFDGDDTVLEVAHPDVAGGTETLPLTVLEGETTAVVLDLVDGSVATRDGPSSP